ncbi:helix-turn-helix transcriptional regulator [Ruania alba]|uniref:Regulatory protein, luxR family n=1 Tax=Ruania alba TaxID=648782 RepID=A0A1H5M578_9MICO|nr:LuxR C-terminal-related transcriptional regulator [Ruania alba]SEE83821.1 regulatory protein, luxR family [Ruania alba]
MRQAVAPRHALERVLPGPDLAHLAPGELALLSGPFGSGKSTYVSQWLAASEHRFLWWTPSRALPNAADARELAPDVLVLRLSDADERDAQFVLDCRRLWPDARMVVLSPYGWPNVLHDSDLRVEVAVTARGLCFTPEQTAAWALECGVPITDAQAEEIVVESGGYAIAVGAVIQETVEADGFDESVCARGCDRGVAELATAASAGIVPWALWELFLMSADAGELTVGAMEELWSTALHGPEGLRAMRNAGFIGEQGRAGYLGLPGAIREACRRRISTDLPQARRAEVGVALADSFAAAGRLDDALAVLRSPELAEVRLDFTARHWARLHELPAGQVRAQLTHAGPNPDPRLLVAHARAICDVLQRDHPGHLTRLDRERATLLLDQAGRRIDQLDDTARAVLASLMTDERGRRRINEAGEDAVAGGDVSWLVRPALAIQNGVVALGDGRSGAAGDYFAAAAHEAQSSGLPRLAGMADDLRVLVERLQDDPLPVHRAAALPSSSASGGSQVARLIRLISAVETLDVPVLQEVLVRPGDVPIPDEPVVLHVMQIYVQVLALMVVGSSRTTLAHLDVASSAVTVELSTFESAILTLTRATALAHAGETSAAWTLLAETFPNPASHGDVELLRTQILIAQGRDDEALRRLDDAVHRSGGQLGRKGAWAHMLRSVAYRHLGDHEESNRSLTVAIMAAARSHLLFPFARMGRSELTAVVAQAQRLDLDASSRALVEQLTAAHDALRRTRGLVPLSEREAVLLRALVGIDSVRRLGRELHVSPNTVKTQLRNLYRKLEVSSRAEALRVGRLMRLIPPEGDDAVVAGNERLGPL